MQANKERGELPLTVGETTYVMKITANAICQMETASGLTLDEVVRLIQRGSVTGTRWYLWAVLLPRHPEITVPDVGEIIDQFKPATLQQLLNNIMALNVGEMAEVSGNPPTAQPGTGVDSTLTPAISG